MANPIEELRSEAYINLITFRKNGTAVRTPVWFVHVGDKLGIYTNGKSYKVKRLRRNTKVEVAACNVRGKVHGPWYEGTGELVSDSAREQAVYDGLKKKYGLRAWVALTGGKLIGKSKEWKIIEVTLGTLPEESSSGT